MTGASGAPGVGIPGRIGRGLLALAAVIVLFVAYQLWGTGLVQSHRQADLRRQFDQAVRVHDDSTHRAAANPGSAPAPAAPPPAVGQPVGTLVIPEIDVDQVVVQGVGTDQLAEGPGHYPGTPLPGQDGNAAIAGHRTTHGRPFYDLQNLAPGDPLTVTTVQGTFRYAVVRTEVVAPTDLAVLDPTSVPELTLTTCNPRYSAAQRLVVVARMVTPQRAAPAGPPVLGGSGGGEATVVGSDPVRDAVDWLWLAVWAVALAALAVVVRLWRRRPGHRPGPALVAALPVALVCLYFLFGAVNTLLPPTF